MTKKIVPDREAHERAPAPNPPALRLPPGPPKPRPIFPPRGTVPIFRSSLRRP